MKDNNRFYAWVLPCWKHVLRNTAIDSMETGNCKEALETDCNMCEYGGVYPCPHNIPKDKRNLVRVEIREVMDWGKT